MCKALPNGEDKQTPDVGNAPATAPATPATPATPSTPGTQAESKAIEEDQLAAAAAAAAAEALRARVEERKAAAVGQVELNRPISLYH